MPSSAAPAQPQTDATVQRLDWLDLARALPPASVDLLYADPPFNTGKTQRGTVRDARDEPRPSGGPPDRTNTAAACLAYPDTFPSTAHWLAWLRERLRATLPALKPTAAILLHLDWRTSHHARILLEELLSPDHFVNHLVWSYGLGGSSPRRFARKHDDILFFAVTPDEHYFDPPRVPATSNRMRGDTKKARDVLDIPAINNMATERTGYPTQKPLALLSLLIGACCPPGGVVLDPCCGSGTTLVAAAALGRRAIGADINPDAVTIARDRLERVGRSRTTPAG